VQAVDILFKSDRFHHLGRVDVLRQWRLHKNAVHLGIGVELSDARQQRDLSGVGWQAIHPRANANLFAGQGLVTNINGGRRIVANEDDSKSGSVTCSVQARDPSDQRVTYLGGERLAIDDASGHATFRFAKPASLRAY
jgi:hypothetical protein